MNSDRRPVGLFVLAVIQFIFTVLLIVGLIISPALGAYAIISPVATGIVMVVSAIGYLRRNFYLGFVGGNILGFGSLANILIFNIIQGFANFALYIPSLVYPIVLLVLLNFRYKDSFRRERAHQGTQDNRP